MDTVMPRRAARPRGSTTSRDDQGRKECCTCRDWLPEAQFSRNKTALDGLFSQCRNCKRITQTAWAYSLTTKDIERLLDEQNHRCAICLDSFGGLDSRPYFIDHDHTCCDYHRTDNGAPVSKSCGKCVRGLLCRACNTGVSAFKDSPDVLRAATAYVEQLRAHAE